MPETYTQRLTAFPKAHEYFMGIDSDGCAFDSMEIKHKECFIPNTIKHFGLQAISRYTRETAEFVNLYSKWRGINRFPALALTFDFLAQRPEVHARGVPVPRLEAMRDWLTHETTPGNPALEAQIQSVRGSAAAELRSLLAWSRAVNATVADIVHGVPPFPFVRDCLQKASEQADIMVVSATPFEALEREWKEQDIARYAALIAGQEMGTKTEQLRAASEGKYGSDRVLVIGDAPSDMQAARANDALFYPINPGAEAESWERLLAEALDKFFAGTYQAKYEAALIADFEACLPDTPPWRQERA
ncbi:MAG TPA: HAD family hydrolase [Phycisphaerae bacterium]|nr:HAD family hydrolase [Phycisphaerae bacterium]